jgi:hypothetical protein
MFPKDEVREQRQRLHIKSDCTRFMLIAIQEQWLHHNIYSSTYQ